MPQNYYIKNPNEQPQAFNPNKNKIFLKNSMNLAGWALAIIAILLFVNWQVGLNIFLLPFQSLNIGINPLSLLLYLVLAIIVIFIALSLGSYSVASNIRYEIFADKLVMHKNIFLVFFKVTEIPFQNIIRVSYDKSGIFQKIFNSGDVVLELSGMKSGNVKFEFIDNPEEIAQYVENARKRFAYIQQAQEAEKYKVENILNRQM